MFKSFSDSSTAHNVLSVTSSVVQTKRINISFIQIDLKRKNSQHILEDLYKTIYYKDIHREIQAITKWKTIY